MKLTLSSPKPYDPENWYRWYAWRPVIVSEAGDGSTPEEAVANLWLELNLKKKQMKK